MYSTKDESDQWFKLYYKDNKFTDKIKRKKDSMKDYINNKWI